MPPRSKAATRKKSMLKTPEIIPIYDLLLQSTASNSVQQIIRKLQIQMKDNSDNVIKSLFILIIQLCGLSEVVQKIDLNDTQNSLHQIIEELEQNWKHKKHITIPIILIQFQHNQHEQLRHHVKQLLDLIISQDLSLLETSFLEQILSWLSILSQCKLRKIRSATIFFLNLFIDRQIILYNELIDQKQSRKAYLISSNIKQFFEKIISLRLKDIDNMIRENVFNMMKKIIIGLENQFININLLEKYLTPLLKDNNLKIVQNCLNVIYLFYKEIRKCRNDGIKWAKNIIQILEDIAFIPNKNGILALKSLLAIFKLDNSLQSLKPNVISKIFELYGHANYHLGLQVIVEIFYESLYSSKQFVIENRVIVVMQIINLLSIIGSSKLIKNILHEFFIYHQLSIQNIIHFQELFVILFVEEYQHNGNCINLKKCEIELLITIITNYAQYIDSQLHRYAETKQQFKWKQISLNYNKNVLNNCKQIIFQKIPLYNNSQIMVSSYLNLFVYLFLPIIGTMQTYVDFIITKVVAIFKTSCKEPLVVKSIVNIFGRFKTHDISVLTNQLQSDKHVNQDQIVKISNISQKYYQTKLISIPLLQQACKIFLQSNSQSIKLQICTYLFSSHQWIFFKLMSNLNNQFYSYYVMIRNLILKFILQTLETNQQKTLIKLGCFNILCRILKIICNAKLIEFNTIYYHLNSNEQNIIFNYIESQLNLSSTLKDNTNMSDISILLNNLSFQSQEVKEEILKITFSTFKSCIRISLMKRSVELIRNCLLLEINKYPLLIKQKYCHNFLKNLVLLEVRQQNSNKFTFWRMVIQLIQYENNSNNDNQIIIGELLKIYFHKKMNNVQYQQLLNKLILFIVGEIDKNIQKQSYERLNNYYFILKTVYRRFNKEVLYRLAQFIKSKNNNNTNQHVTEMIKLMDKISTQRNVKKQQEQSQQSEDDNEENINRNGEMEVQQQQHNKSKQSKHFTRGSVRKQQRL